MNHYFFKTILIAIPLVTSLASAEVIKLDRKTAVQFAVENAPRLEATRREMAISDMER
ncbi:MAG: hypothetical protein IT287_01100, partial [Bdellovibrionaceae bacterium]|nr:hypothetical protein [Pseudobdellovibrionaceae bacterium]